MLALSVIALPLPSAFAKARSTFDLVPVKAAVGRLLATHATQIELTELRKTGNDHYRITGTTGHIHIAGDSPSALLFGLDVYLHRVAKVDIGWPGESISRLPLQLPAPSSPIDGHAIVPDRFALNDTDDAYSNAYLDWDGWQHKIDLLALHGINEVFMPVGAEEVYRRTFEQFGYDDTQIRQWIPDPAHQPWWLLQNLSGIGAPVSAGVYARRVAMGQKIVARLRELGMTPVFPGYYGTVPTGFAKRYPAANLIPQGDWGGLQRPDWLDPREPLFGQIAAAFYREQRTLFGDSTLYKMDLLHEGGEAGNVPPEAAAQKVWQALHDAHPEARWVLLGWESNPTTDEIEGAGKEHLLLVDGLSDRMPTLDREKQWLGAPYAFGSIPNFGGHQGLGANTSVWFERFPAWLGKSDSAMRGIAYLPEGTGTDPAAFTLFTRLGWSPTPTDRLDWFRDYADYRYGGKDAHAEAAWRAMAESAYAMPPTRLSESQDSLFAAAPDLKAQRATMYGPREMRYDTARFASALTELLQVAPTLRDTTAYRHDLVDVARQALDNRSRVLLPQLRAAYENRNAALFSRLSKQWLDDMTLLDQLLATDPNLLLGRWLAPARSAGTTSAEGERLAYQQLILLIQWSDDNKPSDTLNDYANREYAGLMGAFYRARWQRYFDALRDAMRTHTDPPAFDWVKDARDWANTMPRPAVQPTGDPHRLAAKVADRLGIAQGEAKP
jgi:alpha-N-acetylglucosaminidase